jgi:hypothetical protein
MVCAIVPFDLFVSRAPTFEAITGPVTPGPLRRLISRISSQPPAAPPRPPEPIASDEFHAVMSGAPATRRGDHVYWLRYPDGDPWFVAEWKAEGYVLLSTSYTHARYLRNCASMFDQGLTMAGALRARLFEEVEQREITPRNIDALLATSGRYFAIQVETWRRALVQLSEQAAAPLEFPLGPIDMVSDYLVFHLAPARPIDADALPRLIEIALGAAVKVLPARDGAWNVVQADGDQGLTKILRRPDGRWQVWPTWGQASFPRIAETTLAVAEQLHRAAEGELQFLGRPFTDAIREDLRRKAEGLGVDFYLWTQSLPAD